MSFPDSSQRPAAGAHSLLSDNFTAPLSANPADERVVPTDKSAVRSLPSSLRQQLRGQPDQWALLQRDYARQLRSGDGIQFYEQDKNTWRKTTRPGSSDWVCLVNDAWVQQRKQRPVSSGSVTSTTQKADAQSDLEQVVSAQPKTTISDDESTAELSHSLALSLINPDQAPMPDARYQVKLLGQTHQGRLNEQGEAQIDFLPAGEAEVKFSANEDALPTLRQDIQKALDGLVSDAADRQQLLDDLLFENGFVEGTLIIGVIWAKAVFDRGVDLVDSTADMVKGTPDAMASVKSSIYKAMQDADKDGVVDGLGMLTTLAQEVTADVERFAAVTSAIMEDAEIWSMLVDFPGRYYDHLSAEDKAKLFGAASFDLIACFVAAAAIAKAASAAQSLRASAGVSAIVATSAHFIPLVKALKRVSHLYELKQSPVVRRITLSNSEHKLTAQQRPNVETVEPKPVVHDSEPARTDTNKATQCAQQTECRSEPISMVTGEELFEMVDFTVPGPVPLQWKRTYRTTASGTRSELGYGWSHPWALSLLVEGDTVWLRTEEGMKVPFRLPADGDTHRHVSGSSLSRKSGSFSVYHNDQRWTFEPDPHTPNRLRPTQVADSLQREFWQLKYQDSNSHGRLVSAKSTWGDTLEFHWQAHGLQRIDLNREEHQQTLVRYRVDRHGDLIAAKRVGFPTEQYRYQNHLFSVRQAESGVRYQFEWDELTPNARCIHQVSDDGHYDYQFDWDYQGETPEDDRVAFWNKTTDSNGVSELFGYDSNALLLCHVQGDGGTEYFYYDGHQQLTKHKNTEGQYQRYRYDARHRLAEQVDVLGQTTRYRYHGTSQLPEKITGPQGQTLQFQYDIHDRLICKIFSDGRREQYRYEQGRLSHKIDPLGQVHRYRWHAHWGTLARYECFSDAKADSEPKASVDFHYDEQGRLISQRDQLGHEQNFVYDDKGQLITRSNQHGQAEHFQYDALGRVIAQTDSAGRTTEFHYGRYAQLEAKTLPDGHQIKFEYDRERNLTALINPNGAAHRFEYDGCERISREITVDGRTTDYHYNTLGHLTGLSDNGIDVLFARDTNGRLLSERYLDPARPDAEVFNRFDYDAFGQLIRASNAQAEIEFDYNDQGQLIQESSTHHFKGAFGRLDAHRHENHFEYTAFGQLHRLHHKAFKPETPDMQFGFIHRNTYRMRRSSWQETYHWHDDGTLAELRLNAHAGEETLLQQKSNDRGQITERTQGQHRITYGYDTEQRLQRVQRLNQHAKQGEAAIQERQYQYDAAGRISQLDDRLEGTFEFHYNAVDALTAVNDQALQSDAVGNRLPEGLDTLLDNRLPFWGDRHYEYDAWGNIVTIRRGQGQQLVQKLCYNAKHQLIELIEYKQDSFVQRLTFAYDALGRRIRKEVITKPDSTQYDYAEHTVWRGQQPIQTRVYDSSKRCTYDQTVIYQPDSHVPLALLDSDQGLFDIDTDHSGTPKAMYRHDVGTEVWQAQHNTYGELKQESATDNRLRLNLRFQGQTHDRETGLYYNVNRYYDPHAGRYINHDPIGLMGGLNAYQYCPNPVEWVDPLGLSPDELVRYKPVESLSANPGARETAINRAWALEKKLINEIGAGTRNWNPEEMELIKSTKNKDLLSVMSKKGYTGHHINSVKGNGELGPKWQGDPRNIVFLENADHPNGSSKVNEHLSSMQGHRGIYENNSKGRLIDRQAMLDQYRASQIKDCPKGAK